MMKVVYKIYEDDPSLSGFLTVTVNIGFVGKLFKIGIPKFRATCRLATRGARSMSQRKFGIGHVPTCIAFLYLRWN